MKGSCLCRAIEYEIDSIDMPVAHCHCRIWRRSAGDGRRLYRYVPFFV